MSDCVSIELPRLLRLVETSFIAGVNAGVKLRDEGIENFSPNVAVGEFVNAVRAEVEASLGERPHV